MLIACNITKKKRDIAVAMLIYPYPTFVLNHTIAMGTGAIQAAGYPPFTGWSRYLLSMLQIPGVFAVPTLLFISGSFVAYAAKGDPPSLTFRFISSNVKHILWPYLIWSVVFYVLIYFHNNQSYTLLQYLKNLIVGYPFHFIPLLVFYYIISPLLVRIAKPHGLLLIILIGLYQFLLLSVMDPEILGFSLPSWTQSLTPPVIRQTMANWAIFFPLGMVYGMNAKKLSAWAVKLKWFLGLMLAVFLVIAFLDSFSYLNARFARYLVPFIFVLLIPAIKRDSIPQVRYLENIGKRTYGIYLTHLIVIDLVLWIFESTFQNIFSYPILLFPLVFILGLQIPMVLMDIVANAPTRKMFRYVFG